MPAPVIKTVLAPAPAIFHFSFYTPGSPARPVLQPLSGPAAATGNWGFFCRKEWQLQKNTGLALRLRLGSLDYVNWLERKPGATDPRR